MAKVNPLAYWTLEDTFDYIAKYGIPHHPLHAKGYPSIGDAKDTIPIPEDGSVRFVDFKFEGEKSQWLDYASERKGRFVGLQNKDGSTKTECGIHVAGAERTFERDLWEEGKSKVRVPGGPTGVMQGFRVAFFLNSFARGCAPPGPSLARRLGCFGRSSAWLETHSLSLSPIPDFCPRCTSSSPRKTRSSSRPRATRA